MKSLHKYFHWFYYKKRNKHLFSLVLFLFFWLFLSIAQPFGINDDYFFPLLLWLLPRSALWFVIIFLVDIAIDLALKEKQRERVELDLLGWLIKLVLIIHAIYLYRGYACDWICIDFLEYLQLIFACLLIFFLVYLPFANYAKSIYLKSVFSGNELELKEHQLQLGEGKNALVINLQQVIYIQADDNHLDIYSLNDQQGITKEIYRSTLTSMDQLLRKKDPSFKKVHRSYLVNLKYFKSFESSSGRYQLQLEASGHDFKIPVSRKYKSALQDLL